MSDPNAKPEADDCAVNKGGGLKGKISVAGGRYVLFCSGQWTKPHNIPYKVLSRTPHPDSPHTPCRNSKIKLC